VPPKRGMQKGGLVEKGGQPTGISEGSTQRGDQGATSRVQAAPRERHRRAPHPEMFRSALAQATQRARAMRGGLPVAQLWVSSGRESSRAPKFHGVSTEVRRKEVVGK
jgi:hypothetical protein